MAAKTDCFVEVTIPVKCFPRVNMIQTTIKRHIEHISSDLDKDHCPRDIQTNILNKFKTTLGDLRLFIFVHECIAQEDEFNKLISDIVQTCSEFKCEDQTIQDYTLINTAEFEHKLRCFRDSGETCVFINLLNQDNSEEIVTNIPVNFSDDTIRQSFESCLYHLLPQKLSTRLEIQNTLDNLLKKYPELNSNAESHGCRLFHLHDSLLAGVISRVFEQTTLNKIEETINCFTYFKHENRDSSKERLSTYLAHKEIEVPVWAEKVVIFDKNKKAVLFTPRRLSKEESIDYQKQLMIYLLEKLFETFLLEGKNLVYPACPKTKLSSALHSISSYLNGMFIGIIISDSRFLSNLDVHSWRRDVALHLTKFLRDPNVVAMFDGELLEVGRFFEKVKCRLPVISAEVQKLKNRLSDEIPYYIQISLYRIHAVKSIKLWYKEMKVLIDADAFDNEYEETEAKINAVFPTCEKVAIEKFPKDRKIQLKSGIRQGTKLLRVDRRHGSLATFARDKKQKLYCLTCNHVAPIESEISIIQCKCTAASETCDCQEQTKIGTTKYTISTDESQWGWLIDLSAISILKDFEDFCDTSIIDCKGETTNVEDVQGKFETMIGETVYKWGAETAFTDGTYAGIEIIYPEELDKSPRKYDLITSEKMFGYKGDSGSLVSFSYKNGNAKSVVSPAFIFIGDIETDDKKSFISYCFRLHESLHCLALKYNTEFLPCFLNRNKTMKLSKSTVLVSESQISRNQNM